jgi:hypothetical protein
MRSQIRLALRLCDEGKTHEAMLRMDVVRAWAVSLVPVKAQAGANSCSTWHQFLGLSCKRFDDRRCLPLDVVQLAVSAVTDAAGDARRPRSRE